RYRMSRASHISRRTFHKLAAGTVATLAVPTIVRGRNLNDKLNIAMIACGGRGGANMRGVASENITVLCDVDANAVEAAARTHKEAAKVTDFRKVFDKPAAFDAGGVRTCEQTHAPAPLVALKNGKPLYC